MSLLAEVLSSADEVELDRINSKVPEISLAAENYKSKFSTFLENVYVTFSEKPKINRKLFNDATRLYNDTTNLVQTLEHISKKDIPKVSFDVEKYSLALKKANIALGIVVQIRKIHEGILRIEEYLESKMYVEAMKEWKSVKEAVGHIPEDERVDALESVKVTIDTQKNAMCHKLSCTFRDNIILSVGDNEQLNTIKIYRNNEEITEVLQALYIYTSSIFLLDEVTKFIWHHIFVPVVDYETQVEVSDDGTCSTLQIKITNSSQRMPYKDVFANLEKVVNYLGNNFNYKVSDDLSSISYVGRDLRDNLSELIIKHCLQETIPSTNEGLERYKLVIEDTEELEKVLVENQIFTKETQSILDYASNIDLHFINKRCQEYLKIAKTIMMKDLHHLKEVGTPHDANDPLVSLDAFSKCCVSKNVLELLNFIEKILQEAICASDVCAGRLFCTVQKIIEQYTTFVPEYHKKLLQTIPQQIALYHNNCLFIAEKLTEWNEMYSQKLVSKLNIESQIFRDDMYTLKTVASEMFSTYVDNQIKQIEEIMKDIGLENVQMLEKLEPITEKCVRQCLRQQELLKTVWGKVLSYSVYNKTLGLILDSLCRFLINAIIKIEDISSTVAEQLVDILKIVVTRGPKLFTDPKEVTLFVSSWYKFNELVFVLSASLLDINDRWADGKGPLALQFKPEELKKLIRALFQNTDRRAALLAKIM